MWLQFQFFLLARDNGSPARFSMNTATVTITVYRNLFPPRFHGEPYTASLNFNSPSGSTVRQVNATDADAQVRLSVLRFNPVVFVNKAVLL